MTKFARFMVPLALMPLSACSSLGPGESGISDYALVRVRRVSVGNGSMTVIPPQPWNRHRGQLFDHIREVEDWTLNGPILDSVSFVTGLKSGNTLVRQRRKADQQVPNFRSDMTPPEIAALVESLYRVRGGAVDFKTIALKPRSFLGQNGFELDYEHLDDDELWRKGRVVGAVVNGRLYMILIDAARAHYYGATLPDFEAIVASARLRA